MPGSLARRGNDRVWTASASGLSSCHRHHASAMRAIAISLVFALFWRDCEKKSEQLMSGGCFREILRFLDVARTRAGSSEAWNIKDFMLLTVLGDGDRFSKNRGKGLRGEIFRCSSRFLDGIGRIGEILRFRPAVTWRASPQSTSRQRVARSATWPCAPRPGCPLDKHPQNIALRHGVKPREDGFVPAVRDYAYSGFFGGRRDSFGVRPRNIHRRTVAQAHDSRTARA